jgi:nucleoid-associated protein YgaU
LVLVLLGVVVLIVWTGGKNPPLAAGKSTVIAAGTPEKKTQSGSRIVSNAAKLPATPPAASTTPPAPPPAKTAAAPDAAASLMPGATSTPPAGDAAKAPPADPATTSGGIANATTTKTIEPSKSTATDTKSPLLDPTAYLADNNKKATTAGAEKSAIGTSASTKTDTTIGASTRTTPGAGLAGGAADIGSAKTEYTTYVTKKDDTLWELSVRFLDDGTKWREIIKLNPSLPPDGKRLPEGFQLRIPPPAALATQKLAPPPPPSAPPNTRAYTIKSGDKLWSLALKFYGDGAMYKEILASNPGLDQSRLPLGKTIFLPVLPGKGPKGLDSPTKN